jgi:nitrogen PTS system EIIA component
MIRISSNLAIGAIVTDVNCQGKTALLDRIATIADQNYGADAAMVSESLQERERLGPTGFGGGTAIPHCKAAGLESPVGIFVRLEKPIEYQAVDDEPVDLVFALVSPIGDGAAHLRALAEVSRMFRDEKFCAQLRGAADADAIFALMTMTEQRDAA